MRSRRTIILLTLCGAALVRCAAVVAGDGPDELPLQEQIDASGAELTALRERIGEHRVRLDELSSEERDAEQKLRDITAEMGLVKTLLTGLDNREKMLAEQSDSLTARLLRHEEDYSRRRSGLSAQLRQLYMHGRRRSLELILTADSFSSLMTRLKFAAIVAQQDSRLLERARDRGISILRDQRDLQAARAGIWEAREEAAQERIRLEDMEFERRAALAEVQRAKSAEQANLASLQANERRLSDMLADLEQARQLRQSQLRAEECPFAQAAGEMKWPVEGEILQAFGSAVHEEFGTVTLHNGVQIAASLGAPVYAVEAGKVEFADELPGFGLCVILDHGAGYYSLYAHLSRVYVSRGGQAERNEVLAEVGSLPGEETPQLYFEIRQGKTPLDPLDWLEPRRR